MPERGYTLIDFTPPPGLWPDRDRVVRFMEYVRANFARIVRGVPARCEADLFASGHAHNPGLLPLLGLWAPREIHDQVSDPFQMIDEVSAWCAGLSEEEVDMIVTTTTAPTWEELIHIGAHPRRENSD